MSPEDPLEPCCPIHQMPIKLGTVDDDDINWAFNELRRHGVIVEEET